MITNPGIVARPAEKIQIGDAVTFLNGVYYIVMDIYRGSHVRLTLKEEGPHGSLVNQTFYREDFIFVRVVI